MKKLLSVLIISDNPIIADDIKNTLQREGYLIPAIIRWKDDAAELIALIEPDLVIADLLLKDGADLIDAGERINLLCIDPVVFIAGEEIEEIMPELGLAQFAGYILKPYSSRDLQNTIEITYSNFINSRKKEELVENTKTSAGYLNKKFGETAQELKQAANPGMLTQLAKQLTEINKTFDTYFFGKEILFVVLKQYGDIIYCNDNFSRMCGIPCSRLTGENIITFIAPQDKYNLWKIMAGWAGSGRNNKEDKSIFFYSSLTNNAQNESFRLYSCLEEFKDNQGESCLGMISVAVEAKEELNRLREKIKTQSHEPFKAGPFVNGLSATLKNSAPLRQRTAPELHIRFRRSIRSLTGYAEHLVNGIDNLSGEEIKSLAGKINAYSRIIYSLTQDDDLD